MTSIPNRVNYLSRLLPEDYVIVPALIATLKPAEACQFFQEGKIQNFNVRRHVAKKIAKDILVSYEECHKKIVAELLCIVSSKMTVKTESSAYVLDVIYPSLPKRDRDDILRMLLGSRYTKIRNRGYKHLINEWSPRYKHNVMEAWQMHHDTYCAELIAKHFPISYLKRHYIELMPMLPPWQLSKLFIKIGARDLSKMEALKEADPISYLYVLVKLGKKVSLPKAKEFLKENHSDERIGLLLWCFGQMGHWDAIVEFKKRYVKRHYLRA